MSVRVRFAPSPTGHLHVGGARTALFNWLFARHNDGKFILRIEDTDQERSTEESIEKIVQSLKWLGLDWDEYYRQTERSSLYLDKAKWLKEKDSVYEQEGAWWFRVPSSGKTVIQDEVMGKVEYKNEEMKDFVIRRSDGSFTYNFACVIDDSEMNISHIMRGDDHLNNTPKQILVYRELDIDPPKFAHFPMILGEDKKRLSKRHGATSVLKYREKGFLPQALRNFLARLGWSHGDQEIFSREELIELFEIKDVGSSPAIFDDEKLTWINHHWLKEMKKEDLGILMKEFLIRENIIDENSAEKMEGEKLAKVADLMRERNKTLVEIAHAGGFAFADEIEYEDKLIDKYIDEKTGELLLGLADALEKIPEEDFIADNIDKYTRKFVENSDAGLGDIGQPCRVAVTGRDVSPGLFVTMELPGKERTISRLRKVAQMI